MIAMYPTAFFILFALPIFASPVSPTTTQSTSSVASSTTTSFLSETSAADSFFLSNTILNSVPECALECFATDIVNHMSVAENCTRSPTLDCLCGLTTDDGDTLVEVAQTCIKDNCTGDDADTDVSDMCSAKTTTLSSSSTSSSSSSSSSKTSSSTSIFATASSTSADLVITSSTTSTASSTSAAASASSTAAATPSMTTSQAVGLAIGLTGAVILSILAILLGRRRRRAIYAATYNKDMPSDSSPSNSLDISAPLHDGPPASSPPPTFDHFGASGEGQASELYMMEVAPSTAFIKPGTQRVVSDVSRSTIRTVAPYSPPTPEYTPPRSTRSHRLPSISSHRGHQRLPSEDISSNGSSPFHSRRPSERKLPPRLPLSVNVTPPPTEPRGLPTPPQPVFNLAAPPAFPPSGPRPLTQDLLGLGSGAAPAEMQGLTPVDQIGRARSPASFRSATPPGYVRGRPAVATPERNNTPVAELEAPAVIVPGRKGSLRERRNNPALTVTVPAARPSAHERIVKVSDAIRSPEIVKSMVGHVEGSPASTGNTPASTAAIPPPVPSPPSSHVKQPPMIPGFPSLSKYEERASMMTEFEEDSMVSSRERRMAASGASYSSPFPSQRKSNLSNESTPSTPPNFTMPRPLNIKSPNSVGSPASTATVRPAGDFRAYSPNGRTDLGTSTDGPIITQTVERGRRGDVQMTPQRVGHDLFLKMQ